MTQIATATTPQEQRYEAPTFAPSGAFATTLRSAEMARKGRPVRQSRPPVVREARSTNGVERRYETPTFSPSGAFATTLRSAEVARRDRERQSFDSRQPDILACAA
jgi:hypothetical protein